MGRTHDITISGFDLDRIEADLKSAKAENARLREELEDWHNAAKHVEADHPDEAHCGCVPILRKQNTELRTSLGWLVRACEQRIPWGQREKLDEELRDAKHILSNNQITNKGSENGH